MATGSQPSLSDQAYEAMRRNIVERRLQPDTKLDITSLQQMLGMSRMPIVNAITRLKHEGLLTSRRRVGTFVTPLDRRMFEEIFDARTMMEQWTVPCVVLHISNKDIAELHALLDRTRALLVGVTDRSFDYRTYMDCDQEFHLSLVRLCGNSLLIRMYRSLNAHMQIARAYSLRALSRSIEGQEEHEAILHAFADRDADQARAALLHHAERSRADIYRLLEQHGGEL